jgi:arylsulfatase
MTRVYWSNSSQSKGYCQWGMSADNSREKNPKKARPTGGFSRRDMLLTGTSILAVSGLQSATLIAPAQAQPTTPAAQSGRRPNILIMWGDDIGYWNPVLIIAT